MLKKAVESHQATAAKKTLAQSMFSSSPPAAPGQRNGAFAPTKPLAVGSANVMRCTEGASAGLHAGTKRNASGLAKTLSFHDGFDEPLYPDIGSQDKPHVIGDSYSKGADDVYFDENDFDSDVDLDIEDPATKGHVKYPDLPPPPSAQLRSHIKPTAPRHASAAVTPSYDSGYHAAGSYPVIQSTPDELLTWSSSPADHFKTPAKPQLLAQFAYQAASGTVSTRTPAASEQSRPSKRRTLPWQRNKEEETAEVADTAKVPKYKQAKSQAAQSFFTPISKSAQKSAFPWNTTASAIKEQQKQLRQANKKLVKTNEGTEEEVQAAIASRKRKSLHKVFLSEEQQHVLDLVVNQKKSVFFTGSAGTGKSVLLREIIAGLRVKYKQEPDRIAVTASTGLAACNVGGVTLHSFAGIGLGKEDVPTLVKKIRRNQKAKHRWMRTKVLIIDEISMVDGQLFDKLEEIARSMRKNGRPFGNIQLIITGDFFQLPPVPDRNATSQFAFEAGTWNTSIEHTIGLHHVFRQKDPVFANMLNEMREGRLSGQSIARFRTLQRSLTFEDSLEATELFPTRGEVERANQTRMHNLQGESKIYDAKDGGSQSDVTQRTKLLENCLAPESIQLKKGAQVMLIKNIDEKLVNGSLGKVIGFMSETTFDNYQKNEEEYYATQASEGGEPSTGISEARTKIQEMVAGTSLVYPVVRFAIADGTTRDLLCQREQWKVEQPNGEIVASRSQVPLILAWALSIHKAQGQTLERVKVDLGRVFEKGQAYVALSRATSMAGLQVLRFDPKKVVAHETVRTFYAGLSKAEASMAEGSRNGGKGMVSEKAKKARTWKAEDYERGFVEDEWEV